MADTPLVSLFLFVRNGGKSLRRSVRSVRAQTYPNIEFVVQDAVSTDNTLDIIREEYGPDAKIVSEPDTGTSDGLWRALKRCTGEFVGSCLSDEELLPDAVERAVPLLRDNLHAGAITGDAILTDLEGNQTGFWRSGSFNLIDYLFCDYTPYWVSTFFRRSALRDAGIREGETWNLKCTEFRVWLQLASVHHVVYVPQTFAKYGSHPGQSSSTPKDVIVHFSGRMEEIAKLCATSPLVSGDPRLPTLAVWGQARAFINHAIGQGRDELATELYRIARETVAQWPVPELDGLPYDPTYTAHVAAREAGQAYEDRLSPFMRAVAGQARIARQRRRREASFLADYPPKAIEIPPPLPAAAKAQLHARLAIGYEALGRYREAAETWRRAGYLLNAIDTARFPPDPPVKYFSKQDLDEAAKPETAS